MGATSVTFLTKQTTVIAEAHVRAKEGILCMRQAFVLDPIHAASEKFENAALFERLGLPSTLIRHEN